MTDMLSIPIWRNCEAKLKNLSIPEFRLRTDALWDTDFALLDIVPDDRLGFFNSNRLSELTTFCQNNPEFHIISYFKRYRVRVNAAVCTAHFYQLGQGDKDPELMCIPPIGKDVIEYLRIREFEAG